MAYFLAAHCGGIGFLSRLLFLRSIIRAGLGTALVHNDAAYDLPTTPIGVLTRCFFRWTGYPVHWPTRRNTGYPASLQRVSLLGAPFSSPL